MWHGREGGRLCLFGYQKRKEKVIDVLFELSFPVLGYFIVFSTVYARTNLSPSFYVLVSLRRRHVMHLYVLYDRRGKEEKEEKKTSSSSRSFFLALGVVRFFVLP